MSRRVVRVISIEGNPDWVKAVLGKSLLHEGSCFFTKGGTVKELQRIELHDGERLMGALSKVRE